MTKQEQEATKPKAYYTLSEEFGQGVAETYLSKCKRTVIEFTGDVMYFGTRESHDYRLLVATGKTREERDAVRKIDWAAINDEMVRHTAGH